MLFTGYRKSEKPDLILHWMKTQYHTSQVLTHVMLILKKLNNTTTTLVSLPFSSYKMSMYVHDNSDSKLAEQ